MNNKNEFASLGVGAALCRALADMGYEQPTPIQTEAIPQVLSGNDLLGLAQTGTGKTAAFSLPLLEQLLAYRNKAKSRRPRMLILAPTRELAAQIRDEIESFATHTPLRCTCIFGGVGQGPQVKALSRGVEILVATPGRLLDLAQSGFVEFSDVAHLVLDEADRLLDMGFIRDIRKIVGLLPTQRQSLLFSATMPKEVTSLANDILSAPVQVNIAPEQVAVERIEQHVLMVDNANKQAALQQLLFDPQVRRAIVFTRTKYGADRVAKKLSKAGVGVAAVHGNKSQNARTRALASFKSGEVWVLVATDIAARGIDIDGITHVVNFELPHEPESYVHRIGRTARAGAAGVAWSLVDGTEVKRLKAIERLLKFKLPELSVEVSSAPSTTALAPTQEQVSREGGRRRRRRPRRRKVA